MRNLIILITILSITSLTEAQVSGSNHTDRYMQEANLCGGMDSVLSRKGSWKKNSDDLAFPDKTFPRSQYKFIHTRTDSIYSLVKEAFPNLNGFEPRWYRSIRGDAYFPDGPVPYEFKTLFFQYYCNTSYKKILLGDETGTTIKVFINQLNWFMYDADTLDINNDGKVRTIFQLPPKAGKLKEMAVYKLRESQSSTSWSIIIGRNGKVPWRSLTQKEYLTGLKNKYEKQSKKIRESSGSDWDYKEKLKYINDYLAITDEDTLQKPVIIHPKAGIWGFKGKFGNEEEGGFKLVLSGLGEKYFDKSLPRYVPQLIQLYWSYGQSPVSQHIKNQFEENFPLEKLKAMIDK